MIVSIDVDAQVTFSLLCPDGLRVNGGHFDCRGVECSSRFGGFARDDERCASYGSEMSS